MCIVPLLVKYYTFLTKEDPCAYLRVNRNMLKHFYIDIL